MKRVSKLFDADTHRKRRPDAFSRRFQMAFGILSVSFLAWASPAFGVTGGYGFTFGGWPGGSFWQTSTPVLNVYDQASSPVELDNWEALRPMGAHPPNRVSVGYDAGTGEVFVDAPSDDTLTSINIDSAAGIFTGDPAQSLGGSFDDDNDNSIFKATFGESFGSLSFGDVAETQLSEDFMLRDLTVVGSFAGGGDLGDVGLIYIPVPEPGTLLVAVLGFAGLLPLVWRRMRRQPPRASPASQQAAKTLVS